MSKIQKQMKGLTEDDIFFLKQKLVKSMNLPKSPVTSFNQRKNIQPDHQENAQAEDLTQNQGEKRGFKMSEQQLAAWMIKKQHQIRKYVEYQKQLNLIYQNPKAISRAIILRKKQLFPQYFDQKPKNTQSVLENLNLQEILDVSFGSIKNKQSVNKVQTPKFKKKNKLNINTLNPKTQKQEKQPKQPKLTKIIHSNQSTSKSNQAKLSDQEAHLTETQIPQLLALSGFTGNACEDIKISPPNEIREQSRTAKNLSIDLDNLSHVQVKSSNTKCSAYSLKPKMPRTPKSCRALNSPLSLTFKSKHERHQITQVKKYHPRDLSMDQKQDFQKTFDNLNQRLNFLLQQVKKDKNNN